MKKMKTFRRLLSLMMAVIMTLSMSSVAFAAEEESNIISETEINSIEVDEVETTNEEEIEIVSEEGEDTDSEEGEVPTTYSVEVKENAKGTVTVENTTAAEGDTVKISPVAKDGYKVTQVGYWTVDAEGKEGKLVEVAADENGEYSFAMPASNVKVGAAFQDELSLISNKIGGTKETDYTLYMANGESFVKVGDKSASAYLNIDKRFFEIEDATMILEIRQYATGGYTVVGSVEYSGSELKEFVKKADSETDSTYIFENVEIPVSEGKAFNEGWAEYCVVKFARPSWTDAKGDAAYRWTYTGDSTVLGADEKEPEPIVWLYNLDANSYRGALIRSILADLKIPAGTVNSENLNQNIGYLVRWNGYNPVDDPYSSESYDVEYILMGNLTEVQLDDFIDAMQENNIRVNLKSIPTAWTAGKTFAELFDIMAEEDEVLKAAVALDEMIYAAEELDEETYGSSKYWKEFQEVLAKAIEALMTDAEESGEGAALYLNAREELLEMYLKVTNKTMLSGELELVCEKLEDGTYKVSAKLNGDLKNPTFSYVWKPTESTEESIVLSADQLYKVNLEISGTGNFYGELSAKLSVPGAPSYEVVSSGNTISVELDAYEKVVNTPDALGYVVDLYLGEEKVDSKEVAEADTVVFENLEEETEYTVKVNAYNAVGRSDIVEKTVQTGKAGEVVVPPVEEEPDTPDNENGNEDNKAEDKTDSVKTGDNSMILLWTMLLAASMGFGGYTVVRKNKRA